MQPWWINLDGWAAAGLRSNGENRWAFPAGSALGDFWPLRGAGVGGDRVKGLVVFELVGKGGHHAPERGGLGGMPKAPRGSLSRHAKDTSPYLNPPTRGSKASE